MDRTLVMSSPNVCSNTNGGNLMRRKHSTMANNIYYPTSCVSKASQCHRKTQIECNLLRSQQSILNHHYKCIEGRPTFQECNRKYVVKAAHAIPSFDSESHASSPKNILDPVKKFLVALYWFCNPHSMIGRTLSATSGCLLAVEKLSDISPLFFIGLLQVLVPNFFMDIYVNGVNQLFDLEIDKINKPFLPLVSGNLSITNAVFIVASSAILSFWLSLIIGSWSLIWNVALCFLLWTAYSVNVPLLRWKRSPVLTAMIMFSSWTLIFPITYFLHMQTFVFKRPVVFTRSLIVSMVFYGFYSISLALSKDIPDIEGDTKFGIRSFATRLGKKKVFWICVSLFEVAFGVVLLAGASSSSPLWIKIITGLGSIIPATILWYQTKYVDLSSPDSTRSFYMLNWKLLNVAFLFLPLIR
ncbi:hypothetical protein AAZX31_10G065600 [Glycine max]|uniref:Glycinol 4-dimethylallyltransferase n=1 Tax=Glycine soja TaxID=3848 RepID=A0A445IJ05_GLYSO|nr:glycinol 4-dimethylallyltransferase-like [Glycine soja]XP_040861613.1 glycinol 4-dimethylallyltransferase-like [Glycine max]KAG4397096.1 hypothetical protein GLYMA_10G070200v4 [Glycine max]KAH1137158.1 hypothetical protein GYH30_027226 [Glycine max]KAH1227898.1 Glycinol 4-dimethylallyltransferase [Glycine max]RZB86095.1 Glycinol 4-dimethylallyltransferase [Glycine soja]